MNTQEIAPPEQPGRPPSANGPEITVTLVTAIMIVVVGLTFLFGFGNVLQLGLRLGVPIWVAPLVAPAVDLSVVGLLLGTRQLALQDAPPELLRPARRLLVFSSIVTLALNIAEPVIAGDYGKAAFDAVGPALLIGWSEVGPGLLQAMRYPIIPPAPIPIPQRNGTPASTVPTDDRDDDTGSTVAGVPRQRKPDPGSAATASATLLTRARREDTRYWEEHHRPISAEELRKRLKIGSKRARGLVIQLRADAHRALEELAPAADPLISMVNPAGVGLDDVEIIDIEPAGQSWLAASE